MPLEPEHRNSLRKARRSAAETLETNRRAPHEHRDALERERARDRERRARLHAEASQHHAVIERIHDDLAHDRRLHKEALEANRWLLDLVDLIESRRRRAA